MLLKRKIVGRSRFYDIVHKGWVNVCVFVSLVTLGTAFYAGSYIFKKSVVSENAESTGKEAGSDLAPTINEKQGRSLGKA